MPSFKLNNNQLEEIPNVSTPPSDLMQQLSLMKDQKVHAAQIATGDVLARMNSDIDALNCKKSIDASWSSSLSSAALASASTQLYGMPQNSFAGQTQPP